MSLDEVLSIYRGTLDKSDIEFILANYYSMSNAQMGQKLGEDKTNAVNYFIKMLQREGILTLRGRGYKSKIGMSTDKLQNFIIEHYHDMTVENMAAYLHVTRNTVMRKLRELGEQDLIDYNIKGKTTNYAPILKYLREHYSSMSGPQISSKLNVSVHTVYKAADILRQRHLIKPKKTRGTYKS